VNILGSISRLNLPNGKYVVVGGGVLVALGLVSSDDDIDICVTEDIFARLKGQGWRSERWQDVTVLKHDVYDVGTRFGKWQTDDMLVDALWIKGIPFISLEKLIEWKLQMGRPKDLKHVDLIKSYQSKFNGSNP
jgi:hypothetical protein